MPQLILKHSPGLRLLARANEVRPFSSDQGEAGAARLCGEWALPGSPTSPSTLFKTSSRPSQGRGEGRWHDNRHTLVTELSESGAGDEVIMSIAGHVSRAMLSRYSHVRMEAKRRALDEIAARQRAADEKRNEEAERRDQTATFSQSPVVQ